MNHENTQSEQTHVFRGRSMQEAVAQLKDQLGPDAVIVGTHRGSDRGGRFVEITAAASQALPPTSPSPRSGNPLASAAYAQTATRTAPAPTSSSSAQSAAGPFADRARWLAEQVAARTQGQGGAPIDELFALRKGALPTRGQSSETPLGGAQPVEAPASQATTLELSQLRASISELSTRLNQLDAGEMERSHENSEQQAVVDGLVALGVCRQYAEVHVRRAFLEVPDATREDGDLLRALERIIIEEGVSLIDGTDGNVGNQRVLAFVGSTGIGKTTTIAKLATQNKLKGKKVALITLDTIRLAGVDQLTRFSEVLDVPLKVVTKPSELAAALDSFADYDHVYVDTAGRSPYDRKQIKSLGYFFPEGWGGKVVLTVSCCARQADLFQNLNVFAELRPAALCVTKTDETGAIGAVFSAGRRSALPIAWMTNGQRIPEDISTFDAKSYAGELMIRLRALGQLGAVA